MSWRPRAGEELFLEVNKLYPDAVYHPLARAITIKKIETSDADS